MYTSAIVADPPASAPAPPPAGVRDRAPTAVPWSWQPAPLDGPLVTDRPDVTESTDAVPPGRFQLETGYSFTYDRERRSRIRTHTAPELLLRSGLVDGLELRVGWEGYHWERALLEDRTRAGRPVLREDHHAGAADLSIGVKYKFLEQAGLRPHVGVIAEATAPSGGGGASSGDVDPEVKLLWAYDLTERLALAGNVNLAVPTDGGERFFQTSASLSLGVVLTERVGTYVEYFGFYPAGRGLDAAHSLNGGVTFLLTDNLQLDCRAGFGLNEQADDVFAGVGLAWRW